MSEQRNSSSTTAITIAVGLIVGVAALLTAGVIMGVAMAGHMGPGKGARGGGQAQEPVVTDASEVTIDIIDWIYYPDDVTVNAGASVTWVNHDRAPHTSTADDASWDTGIFARDESETLVFDEPGVYEYICILHPSMVAKLTVR